MDKKYLKEIVERFRENSELICGVDEVGRGPISGPIYASAVIFRNGTYIQGLRDSKELSHFSRVKLVKIIKRVAVAYAYGKVSSGVIDKIGINKANRLAFRRAIKNLKVRPDIILVDGQLTIPLSKHNRIPQMTVIDGDSFVPEIQSASILAKEQRDSYIVRLSKKYPQYQWHKNKGYGSKEHIRRLSFYGPSPIHRMSFKPLNDWYTNV